MSVGYGGFVPGRSEKNAIDPTKGGKSHSHGDEEGKLAVQPSSKGLQKSRLMFLIADEE